MLYVAGSVLLGALNVAGMWLLAERSRTAWPFLIALQLLWVPYDLITRQYGFLLLGAATVWVGWRGYRTMEGRMCLDCSCLEPENDHGDPAHITLTALRAAADASGITPAQAAANILTTVTLANAGELPGGATDTAASKSQYAAVNIIKTVPSLHYSLGPAYPAMLAPGKGADGFNDFISADALEKAAWSWMAKHQEIGLFHQDGLEGHATVVESYIYRGPDWRVISPVDKNEYVIRSGTWMLGTVWDDHGWDLVERGLVNGWSPEGDARRALPTPERLAQLRAG